MTVAFFAWNPFQVYQIQTIAENLSDATLLIEKRKNIDFDRLFGADFLEKCKTPVKLISRSDMETIDGKYEAIVCQTAFPYMENLSKTKIISMQYSMSKEFHQYGPWRALCDLNLVYGSYSEERVSYFGPCEKVGNPRFDRWFSGALNQAQKSKIKNFLSDAKRTVLYLPTWGNLSSISQFATSISELSDHYNIITKVHHKTDSHELDKRSSLSEKGIRTTFGASDDLLYLLDAADVVLSDFSGAIFDAINVQKPVILLQKDVHKLIGAEKFGLESIEYARRSEIGPVVEQPTQLKKIVDKVLARELDFAAANARLRSECFSQHRECGATAAGYISDFLRSGSRNRSIHQIYVKEELRILRRQLESEKKKSAQLRRQLRRTDILQSVSSVKRQVGTKLADARKGIARTALQKIERALQRNPYVYKDIRSPRMGPSIVGKLLPSQSLINVADHYDALGDSESAINFYYMAFAKSKSAGLTPLIRALAKYNEMDRLRTLVADCMTYAQPLRMRLLSRIVRAAEAAHMDRDYIERFKEDTLEYAVSVATSASSTMLQKSRAARVLASMRRLEEAREVARSVKLNPSAATYVARSYERAKDRLGKKYFLLSTANLNDKPSIGPDDLMCYHNDRPVKARSLANVPLIEFFIPPYFFNEHVTDSAMHGRICQFWLDLYDAFQDVGVAVIPRHQFRLNAALPTGRYPAVSYHTTGNAAGWLHFKDSLVPGYFRADSSGYSGWSELASLKSLPEEVLSVPQRMIETTWKELQDKVIASGASKYPQPGSRTLESSPPYILFPLQVVTDTVAGLANIPMLRVLDILVRETPRMGCRLLVKRHPMCRSELVERHLARAAQHAHVQVLDHNIHDMIIHSIGVVTLNSGVGFESLLHGKNVITAALSEYRLATDYVETEADLVRALRNLNQPHDIERTKRFMYLYMRRCIEHANHSALRHFVQETFWDALVSYELPISARSYAV